MRTGLLAVGLFVLGATLAQAESLPMIDTHVHFESVRVRNFEASARTALGTMDQYGIVRSLIMSPPRASFNVRINHDIEELQAAVAGQRERFAVLGGGGSLSIMIHATAPADVTADVKKRFRARAEEILALGAVGFGEIPIEHLSLPAMGPGHAYAAVAADHPLLLLLAEIAAERQVPVDVHFDLIPEDMPLPEQLAAAANPPQLRANLEGFRRLLAHRPQAPIVWSHVGFEPLLTRGPGIVREMLASYPNLYMSFRINRTGGSPAMAFTQDGQLKPAWLELIRDFPDRFLLGSDSFYMPGSQGARGTGASGMNNLRSLIDQLPPELGRQVASDNAIRLYRLAPLASSAAAR